jgi:hypothetical protein
MGPDEKRVGLNAHGMPSEMLQRWRKSQGQTHGDEKHLDEMVVACQVKCFSAGGKARDRLMGMKSTWMKWS